VNFDHENFQRSLRKTNVYQLLKLCVISLVNEFIEPRLISYLVDLHRL